MKLVRDEKQWHGNKIWLNTRSVIPSLFLGLSLFGGVGLPSKSHMVSNLSIAMQMVPMFPSFSHPSGLRSGDSVELEILQRDLVTVAV